MLLAALALATPAAMASHTACTFEGGAAPRYYELEFIGDRDTGPVVVFASTAFAAGKRITLPARHSALSAFDEGTATVALRFRNPGDDALPPSFTLEGRNGNARLAIGGRLVDGTLHCGD